MAALLACCLASAPATAGEPAAADTTATPEPSSAPAASPDSSATHAAASGSPAARDSSAAPVHGTGAGAAAAPAAASTTAHASAAPVVAGAPGATARRGVADTITVLPTVRVDQARTPAPRNTATTVRLERAGVTRFLPANVNDALTAVPGVDLVKMGAWASQVSLRGLSGDRVLVMVDGVRLNSARGHGGQTSLVSIDRIDAVELTPGATSARYGSDALGGVVNVVTHRSLFQSKPSASLTFSARGAEPGDGNAQFMRGQVRAPHLGLEVAGGMGALDALVTPNGTLPNSGYHENNVSTRAAAQLGRLGLDFEHAYEAAHDVGLPVFNGGAGFATSTGTEASYPLQSRDADRLELSAAGTGRWPDARVLGVIQTQRTYFDETSTDSTKFGGRLVRTSANTADDHVTQHSAGVQPFVTFSGPLGVRLSGEYREETAGGPRLTVKRPTTYPIVGPPIGQPPITSPGESVPPAWRTTWSGGAFVSPVVATVRVESGLRYEWVRAHADSTEFSTTAAREDVNQRWTGEGTLSRALGPVEPYVHAATGFRAPNLDELYYNDDIHGGLRLYGNPDLVPETSRSYEVGLRSTERAGEWLPEARVSVYRNDVQDLISFKYVTTVNLVPRFQYVNVEDARIQGIEGMARIRIRQVGLALNAGFPSGINTHTGEHLLDIGVGRVTADLMVPVPRLLPMGQVSARLRWNDAVQAMDPKLQLLTRPPSWVASIEAAAVTGSLRTVFAVRNVFNAYYFEPLSFIPEPGRTYSLAVRGNFNVPLGLGRKGP